MEEKEVINIPFETTRVPFGDKPEGFEEIIEDGVDGNRTIVRVDGQIVSDKTKHPKNKVIYYGTKQVEDVSTPEPPQGSVEIQPPVNTQVDSNSFVPPITGYRENHQGRFSQLGGKIKEVLNINTTALKKAALEAGRLLAFSIPGILITVLTDNPELGGSLGATILLVLKSIDRGIHEDKTTPAQGLLPF